MAGQARNAGFERPAMMCDLSCFPVEYGNRNDFGVGFWSGTGIVTASRYPDTGSITNSSDTRAEVESPKSESETAYGKTGT